MDKIQFYNENTEVLLRMLKQITEDKKIGAGFLPNRVRRPRPSAPGPKKFLG